MENHYSYEDAEKLKSLKYEVNLITKEKLESYFKITAEALEKINNSETDVFQSSGLGEINWCVFVFRVNLPYIESVVH